MRRIACAAALITLTGLLVPTSSYAAGSVRSAVSLTGPTAGTYGSTIVLRGTLWRYRTSTRIANATVYLERSPHGRGTWAGVKAAKTNSAGGFAFPVGLTAPYDYRVRFYGSRTYTGALSNVRYPVVLRKVLLDSLATTDGNTGALRATGRLFPAPPTRTPVYLYRWTGSGWAWLATGYSSGNSVTVNATRPGSVAAYRLTVAARAPYGAGQSAARWYAHYVWRGAFHRPYSGTGPGNMYVQDVPKRDVMTVHTRGHFQVTLFGNGCRRARIDTEPYLTNQRVVYLTLYTRTTGVLATGNVHPSTGSVRLEGNLPGNTDIMFDLDPTNSDTISEVLSNVWVLCTN